MNILLIKRGAMGDILMTTLLIRQLRQNYPTAIIDYVLAKNYVEVLKNNSYLDNIISLEDITFSSRGIFKFIKFVLSIRKKYDYIFSLGKNWQLNLILKLSGSKLIGFRRERIAHYILDKSVMYDDVTLYHGLYNLDLLSTVNKNVNYADISLDLIFSDDDKKYVDKLIEEHKIINPIIITNSGGYNKFENSQVRLLPRELSLKLIAKQSSPVILLGGTNDKESYQVNNVFNWAGVLTVAQSVYLLTLAKHFYTTDCGAMHLGVVAKLSSRMTCFFGPTFAEHVLPKHSKINIISSNRSDINYALYGRAPKINNFFDNLESLNLENSYSL